MALVDPRFVRFLLVGVMNTAFGYGLFLLLAQAPIPVWAAVAGSYLGSLVFNFKATGTLVFANRDNRRIVRFALAFVLMCAAHAWALEALVALGFPLYPASVALLPPVAVVSFLVNRHFVFREVA